MTIPIFKTIAIFTLVAAACHAQGTITTVVGNSKCCVTTDGGLATSNWLPSAGGITLDSAGNLYIWDRSSAKIRKVTTTGVMTTVAGNGTPGYSGDGGLATSAQLFSNGDVSGLAVDAAGNLYIGDGQNHRVRKVSTAGVISTIAGNGTSGFSGDGGLATEAELNLPAGIALDSDGNLYIADTFNNRVRKVNTAGIISTVAGNGNVSFSGDNVHATTTAVAEPEGVAVDSAGNLYIAETSNSRVRKVDPSGIITTIAGQTKKKNGFSGDGGPGTAATLYGPIGMVTDHAGNLYVADNINGRVRKIDATGVITTYAGTGGGAASTPIGDGGPAISAFIGVPKDVAVDAAGNLYIAGSAGGVARVRKVAAAAGLSTTPSSLSFALSVGGATPASQSVSVASAGAAMTFAASASTTSGGNWLAVNPTSGTTPATLSVSVNPAGIPGGVYQGAVTLTPSGSTGSPLSFAVTLTVTGAGAPLIASGGIVNALGYQTRLAPDTVFVLFGTGMGPAALVAGSGPNYPTALGGTSISFTPTTGGAAVNAKIVYTSSGQVAGLLPSSITSGTYAVRVTYNSLASAPQNVMVVARSFGIATSNNAGTGTAQATIGNVNGGVSLTRFTNGSIAFGGHTWTLSPAHAGDTLVLWGTGGGADPANDSGGTSGDQTKAGGFSVIVGGKQITPLYAGASSGYPGLWQINFTLPADVTPDCFASVQVSAGGELSNTVSVPIAATGESACTDSQLSPAALSTLDAGGTIALGGFSVNKVSSTTSYTATPGSPVITTTTDQESISGGIALYTAAEYAAIHSMIRIGACTVNDRTAAANAVNPAAPSGYLDLGPTLPVSGPGLASFSALSVVSSNPGPLYDFLPPNGSIVGGGQYTLKSNGGKGAGPFTASVTFPTSFTVTNWDSLTTIDRAKPLTLNWTGSGLDQVYIIGSSYMVVGKDAANTNILHTVSFTCQVPAAPNTYTVPVAVLSYLLPIATDAASGAKGAAILAVETATAQPFNVSLISGGQVAYAAFSAIEAYSRNLTIQ